MSVVILAVSIGEAVFVVYRRKELVRGANRGLCLSEVPCGLEPLLAVLQTSA